MAALRTDEAGFGLVELLAAMLILSVGVLALASAFTSGAIALRRAGQTATATAIADAQLEQYRALRYCAIALDPASVPAPSTNYWSGFTGPLVLSSSPVTCALDPVPAASRQARQDLTPAQTPDGHRYRVDTYIKEVEEPSTCAPGPTCVALPTQKVKRITVIVRDSKRLAGQIVRQTSTIHPATSS